MHPERAMELEMKEKNGMRLEISNAWLGII